MVIIINFGVYILRNKNLCQIYLIALTCEV